MHDLRLRRSLHPIPAPTRQTLVGAGDGALSVMPHSPSEHSCAVDYASPSVRRRSAATLLVWLMPLWCFAIIMLAYVLGMRDDPFWFVAMGLPIAVALGCAAKRRWTLALYCLAIAFAVIAVGVLLPSLNRTT